ncbi:hypothetical protein CABS01_17068 [Colletotrichum abscissum]|uniref:Uncharacterized protein n=1 Tax=Colletotrichum abscissum TaxID=1671311 RepID=A0A9Q0B463_9PEZI|nr:uncharacterized protein CABS01_17068 [Colletotrichum abscissum]KAI3547769.1 hypothetical protein CABS02_08581 [Colletotrichum abscissum]KAK1494738.1 hypothetical protein CABS01_17068 [Colletotrichum abscissum]
MSRTRDAEDLAKFLRKNLDFAPTEHRLRHPLLYSLADRRCFGSISFLSGRESRIAKRKTTDEKAVEGLVKTIMDELKKAKEVQSAVDLVNGLVFENHPHALGDAAAEITASTSCAAPAQHLCSMNTHEEVVDRKTISTSIDPDARFQYHAERLTAAPSHADLSLMIEGLLEHGLLTTGEAIVFVRLDWRESETLSFHLAEPSAEVEAHFKHADLRTAVAQYLTFGLIALGVPGERHGCRHPP